MGVDKLIDLFINFIEAFRFFTVVDEFERGVVLRFGKFHKELEPGFHFLIPLYVDRVLLDNVVPRTQNLGSQALTTSDGKHVVVSGIVTAHIKDVRKALLRVEGMDDALSDSCYSAIAEHVSAATWDVIRHPSFSETLTTACRKQAFKYGVEISRVQLSDVALARTYRLFNGG